MSARGRIRAALAGAGAGAAVLAVLGVLATLAAGASADPSAELAELAAEPEAARAAGWSRDVRLTFDPASSRTT